MRLNKYLSSISSRRHADELIKRGEVKLNGKLVTELGISVDPDKDVVEVSGKKIKIETRPVIYLLNKPKGVVTTADDPENRQTVLDFVPKNPRVFPCGRLDENTQGLIVLTNDGELCYQLTHPKFEHKKEYFVEGTSKNVVGSIKILKGPLRLNDGPVHVDSLQVAKQTGNKLHFYITIHDGRNRIVRRICSACNIEIHCLTRTKFGNYQLGDIQPGKFQEI